MDKRGFNWNLCSMLNDSAGKDFYEVYMYNHRIHTIFKVISSTFKKQDELEKVEQKEKPSSAQQQPVNQQPAEPRYVRNKSQHRQCTTMHRQEKMAVGENLSPSADINGKRYEYIGRYQHTMRS